MNTELLIAQMLNMIILVLVIGLSATALYKLSKQRLNSGVALGWAALIIFIPVLGAIAFLMWTPPNQPTQHTR